MEITWLEDLIELDAARNFSAAAKARNITQPAFSRRVKALENWVGTQLVDRSSYPVTLTPAGEIVLETARSLSQDMYRLRDECRELATPNSDTLSISALHSLALGIYPGYSQSMQTKIGRFATRMHATDHYDCLESLSLGRCELALCYDQIEGPAMLQLGQFQSLTLMKDPLVLVSPPELSTEMEDVLRGNCAGQTLPLVSYSAGCFLGKMQQIRTQFYYDHGVGFHSVFENSMSEMLKRMILVGLGIGWLPKSTAEQEINEGRMLVLKERNPVMELDVVLLRKPAQGSVLMEKFWKTAEANTEPKRA